MAKPPQYTYMSVININYYPDLEIYSNTIVMNRSMATFVVNNVIVPDRPLYLTIFKLLYFKPFHRNQFKERSPLPERQTGKVKDQLLTSLNFNFLMLSHLSFCK